MYQKTQHAVFLENYLINQKEKAKNKLKKAVSSESYELCTYRTINKWSSNLESQLQLCSSMKRKKLLVSEVFQRWLKISKNCLV